MTTAPDWLAAFPLQPITAAVAALLQGWKDLSARELPHFNPTTREDALTKRLKVYVENHVAPSRGLTGMWAAEDVIGEIDDETGELVEERRTDIVYGWNDETQSIKLVFEFKRLRKGKTHRDHYLRDKGLGRFVTGIYSRKQAVASMVGVLLDPEPDIVPHLRTDLEDAALIESLKIIAMPGGKSLCEPSKMFADASFDTEHKRDGALASTHGTICVSHFFLRFGYSTTTKKVPKPKAPKKARKPKAKSGKPKNS